MMKKTIIIAVAIFLIPIGWRAYRAVVPSSASFTPFVMARVEGPVIKNPDGTVKLQVWFNDAGAAHSGNHWTWLVRNHGLWGKRVVAQGYLGAEQAVFSEPIPLRWIDNASFSVTFINERYGDAQKKEIVKLK